MYVVEWLHTTLSCVNHVLINSGFVVLMEHPSEWLKEQWTLAALISCKFTKLNWLAYTTKEYIITMIQDPTNVLLTNFTS